MYANSLNYIVANVKGSEAELQRFSPSFGQTEARGLSQEQR